MSNYDIAILGAGASGLFCASFLKDKKVLILDSNPAPLRKLLISGGGRCNFTNKKVDSSNFLGDNDFVQKALDKFSNEDLLAFFKERKLDFEVKNKTQFFCKNSAKQIYDILLAETKSHTILNSHEVFQVEFNKSNFEIKTGKKLFKAKSLIVASGGISYKRVGADDIGYKIAQKFGHNIITQKPALVGFTLQPDQFWMKELSGISVKAKVKVADKEFVDNVLFAHRGISGPAILNASLWWKKGQIEIDFMPTNDTLPKRFLKAFLNSHEESELRSYKFAPAGNFGYEKAEVTSGGVDTSEIEPLSFESKKQKGLYFIGEVLDVTGELGGYNFQWAFSSGYCCASSFS